MWRKGIIVLAVVSPPYTVPAAQEFTDLPPFESLDATRQRPLFSPSRRLPAPIVAAPVPPAPVEPVPEADMPGFDLTGIVFGDTTRLAMVRDPSSQRVQSLRVGQTLDDWTVEDITPRSVALSRKGKSVTLELFADKRN